MTTEMPEKAGVFLLELAFSGDTPKKGDLEPKYRTPLVAQGLIALERRGRLDFIALTDAGWDWVAAHLDLRLARTRPTRALTAVLARLRDFLTSRRIALADFVRPVGRPEPQLGVRIRSAYLSQTGGRFHTRVRLTDLRSALADIERPALDEALRHLSANGKVVLFPLDDRTDITLADERDALDLSGVPQHLLYMEA